MAGKYARSTSVSVERSVQEIKETLCRFGASAFAYVEQETGISIAFKYTNRSVRMDVGYPAEPEGGTEHKEWAQDRRRRFRSLLLVIKAKLVAVEDEVASFEQEFLPYLVTSDGQTVAEKLTPELDTFIADGNIKLLGTGSE